ncbi:MAG: metal-dependent hydrolase [Rubrivivax sp.]|nr:metal-dependent hydrolase [Rubrivivax sp.]
MDILAHSLWAGVGIAALGRRLPFTRRTAVITISLAALPDVLQMLPVIGWWWLGDGTFAAVRDFAIAVPGQEPLLPSAVLFVSHHLHCTVHSAVVAGLVTALVWYVRRALWIPLLGWWSHIVIDVFTHSADYYASPVLYPITERGFDGIAWNTPWFFVANYLALGAAGLWVWISFKRGRT